MYIACIINPHISLCLHFECLLWSNLVRLCVHYRKKAFQRRQMSSLNSMMSSSTYRRQRVLAKSPYAKSSATTMSLQKVRNLHRGLIYIVTKSPEKMVFWPATTTTKKDITDDRNSRKTVGNRFYRRFFPTK